MDKTVVIWSRVDRERHEWLKCQAGELGMTISTFLRVMIYRAFDQAKQESSDVHPSS